MFFVDSVGLTLTHEGSSKRGHAWARKAEELLAANSGQMAKDISIYKMECSGGANVNQCCMVFVITSYISNQSYDGNQLTPLGFPSGPVSLDITI